MFRSSLLAICVLLFGLHLYAQQPALDLSAKALQERADEIERLLVDSKEQPQPPSEDRPSLRTSREPNRYEVAPGDVVSLRFQLAPEFDQLLLPVMPDGFVSLKGVGDIWLAGKTLPEVKGAVETAYSQLLRNPEVTVTLDQFQKPYFVAFGQVTNPGKYDLVGEVTATQALGIAGGFSIRAKRRQLVVLRATDGAWAEVFTVDVRSILRGGKLQEDIFLRPGDMLFVPKSPVSLQQYIPRIGYGF